MSPEAALPWVAEAALDAQQALEDLLRPAELVNAVQADLVHGRAGHDLAAAHLEIAHRDEGLAVQGFFAHFLEEIGSLAVRGEGLLAVALGGEHPAHVAQHLGRAFLIPGLVEEIQRVLHDRQRALVFAQRAVDQPDVDPHLGGHVGLLGGVVGFARLLEELGRGFVLALLEVLDALLLKF